MDSRFLTRHQQNPAFRGEISPKVYGGQWSLGQIQSTLPGADETLQIPHTDFFPWILPVTTSALGHIATGIGRNGEPFLTVYYGAREVDSVTY